ncbi:diguanylate cyclase [Motiliproteus sp. SC1-56]|uniref:GGDEF domain-containing protein n=1 Tax=Motiliproteus sp. SC1-56 TaxID=2799565 RepID=UPI001A8C563F|nr:GGDEF domain-containing protein [Motiliproteus sp. SC1-56]
MARRILTFFILLVLTFGLATYLILGQAIDELRVDHSRRQAQLHRVISGELSNTYLLLDSLIRERAGLYRQYHTAALEALGKDAATLDELKAGLSQQAGFEVDLRLISEELLVEGSTFGPDLGLDFKAPAFADVRRILALAEERGQVFLSAPSRNPATDQFQLTTYSTLLGGGYLGVVFTDPQVNHYFESLIDMAKLHPDVEVALFLDSGGKRLVRLDQASAVGGAVRLVVDRHLSQRQEVDYRRFRQAARAGGLTRIDDEAPGGQPLTHIYTRLLGLTLDSGLPLNFLGKITFDSRRSAAFESHFVRFYATLLGLAILFMAALIVLVRYRLVMPLQSIVGAIRNRLPVDSGRWQQMPELHFLAETYNQALDYNEARMKKLSELSVTDPLTGLLNRRYLEQVFANELARAARGGERVGFAMIDVDFFKAYNDLYGHRGGDRALVRVAEILSQQFRRAGDFVFRIGGEEFAVLITDPGQTPLVGQVEQFRLVLENAAIAHHGSRIADVVTASIGLKVIQPGELITPEEVIEAADQALYQAKHAGRNRVRVVDDSA